ncbi:hypothetical protein QN239_10455 [Mycolicibacterium sp. Y3]
MTTHDKLTVLEAALQLLDQNGRAVTFEAMATRFDVDEETAKVELLPLIAEYFEISLPGDDGIIVLKKPTAEARGFFGR